MIELKAKTRENIGKSLGALREKGVLPAIIYGSKQKNEAVEIDYKEFESVYKEAGESALIHIKIGDHSRKTVLIREVQRDPVSGKYIHADFYAIREDQPLKIMVPLHFSGEDIAPAIKDLGGYLGRYVHEIEIEALPKDLPRGLEVDVSELKTFEDKIFVKDIALPPGVQILTNPEEVIAAAEAPISEAELKALEEKPEEKVEEIEVEEKGKKEEEETEGSIEAKTE